jgi:hypothetical protein
VDGVKEGGVRRGAESTRYVGTVVKEASLRFEMGGTLGLMERAVMSGEQVGKMCGVSGGWCVGGGGMWGRRCHVTRLEPTRTGVGSPGSKMDSVVGVRRQETEV